MKNACLYISFLLLLCTRGFSQGTDVIFLIDNSSSIINTEYNLMYASIQALRTEVLECNPQNKITVVQYSGTTASGNPRIYIESGFTTTASTFIRRYNNLGDIPGAVNLVANALNGVTPTVGTITSATTSLTPTAGNALAVFLFTDAPRNNDLLSNGITTPNNNAGFSAYTNLKNTKGAKFVVVNTNATSNAASAGIASKGGSWPGPIEAYSADPDGSAAPNRMFIPITFSLTANDIETVTDFICSIVKPDCGAEYITLSSVANDTSFADNRQASLLIEASNKIYSGGVGLYRSETEVALVSGFHVNAGSRFRGFIEECQEQFEGRIGHFTSEEDEQNISNTNISFFSIAPNPANSIVTITGTEEIQSVLITSLDGKTLYSNVLQAQAKSMDIIIDGYSNGIYNITVRTAQGEIQTKKLVKN